MSPLDKNKRWVFSFHVRLTNPRWRKEQKRLFAVEEMRLAVLASFKQRILVADIPAQNDYFGFPLVPRPSHSAQGAPRGAFERIKLGG